MTDTAGRKPLAFDPESQAAMQDVLREVGNLVQEPGPDLLEQVIEVAKKHARDTHGVVFKPWGNA